MLAALHDACVLRGDARLCVSNSHLAVTNAQATLLAPKGWGDQIGQTRALTGTDL